MVKITLLLSSQQEHNQPTMEFHGVDSWSCNMHCALWSSRDCWQLNHSGYDEFWNLMTMWIQMWFHVTSKTSNLRDARKPETQSNDNILFLKYLGDAYGNYRFSFTLQNIADWEKVLEFLLFPGIIYLENLSDGRRKQRFSWQSLSGTLGVWEENVWKK